MFDVIEGGLPPKELDGDGVAIVAKAILACARVVQPEILMYVADNGKWAGSQRIELASRCQQLASVIDHAGVQHAAASRGLDETLRVRGADLNKIKISAREFARQAEYTHAWEEAASFLDALGTTMPELARVAAAQSSSVVRS